MTLNVVYRRQIRVGAQEAKPVSAAILNAASALQGIFSEFGIDSDRVEFERVSAGEVRCSADELPGDITLSLEADRVMLSIPNTALVLL